MIKKFSIFNESIKSLLTGPSEKEILKSFESLSPNAMLRKSCMSGFIKGIEIALKNGADIKHNNYTIFKNLELRPNKEVSNYLKNYLKLPENPKDFVIDTIKGATITKNKNYDKYITDYRGVSNNIFWEKDNEIILEQDPKSNIFHNLLYVHPKIWCILKEVYRLHFKDTQNIINDVIKEYLNLNGLYPLEYERRYKYGWNEYK